MKICNKSIHITDQLYFLITLIEILELHYIEKNKIVFNFFKTLY